MCWQVRDGRPSMLDATPLHEQTGGYLAMCQMALSLRCHQSTCHRIHRIHRIHSNGG
jgi:hypothetical protein